MTIPTLTPEMAQALENRRKRVEFDTLFERDYKTEIRSLNNETLIRFVRAIDNQTWRCRHKDMMMFVMGELANRLEKGLQV